MKRIAFLFLSLFSASALMLGAGETKTKLSEQAVQGWQSNARFFPNEAMRAFSTLIKKGEGDSRDNQLGLALSLLSYQPVTATRLEDARRRLTELAAMDDEIGLAAQYFLARLQQGYQETPDYPAAAAGYRRLIEKNPTSYWGQLALGKMGIMLLYVLPEKDPARRMAETEALLPLCRPEAARELHMMVADAMLFYGLSKETALKHLVAAETSDVPSKMPDTMRAELMVQIIDISARIGQLPQARAYAKRFKAEYPLDWRNYAIGQILTAVEAGREPPIP